MATTATRDASPTTTAPSRFHAVFHTSERALARRFAREARGLAFRGHGAAAARAWQARARRSFARLLGLDRFARVAARPTLVAREVADGLVREEWLISTERDVRMPFTLLAPTAARGPLPLVLCPHGHDSGGRWSPSGRVDIPEIAARVATYRYDYGVRLARAGCVVACPDARGFGQRREPALQGDRANPALAFASSCHHLMIAGAPLGLTVQGMWTWDLMRLVDHLARDRRVDARRVGVAGLSGGGLQSLDLAAVDTRVRATVVSGYFYGARESLQVQNGNCACNLVPRLWESFDIGDIGALIAPRALFVETGDADPLNGASGLANVRSQVAIARRVYAALGARARLRHGVFAGQHRWHGDDSEPWLLRELAGPG